MNVTEWDFFEERIATLVLIHKNSLSLAISKTCRQFPDKSADSLILAVISFVTHLDNDPVFSKECLPLNSIHYYRVISSLAADVALLEGTGRDCCDLLAFWKSSGAKNFL